MNRNGTGRRPLREAVACHVESRALSTTQLQALLALGHSGESSPLVRAPRQRWRTAALAAALLVGILTGFLAGRAPTPTQLLDRIAEEAVQNHILHMPLEIVASRVADTREYFHRLTFDVAEPARGVSNAAFTGGRYCSLQGVAAAQLRYGGADTADYVTLYQVPLDPALDGLLPATRSMAGRSVEMWRDEGLLYVRVEGPADP